MGGNGEERGGRRSELTTPYADMVQERFPAFWDWLQLQVRKVRVTGRRQAEGPHPFSPLLGGPGAEQTTKNIEACLEHLAAGVLVVGDRRGVRFGDPPRRVKELNDRELLEAIGAVEAALVHALTLGIYLGGSGQARWEQEPPGIDVSVAHGLPCPFCGGKPHLLRMLRDGYELSKKDQDAFAYYVQCISCAATGGWMKNPAGAWRCWGMRQKEVRPRGQG